MWCCAANDFSWHLCWWSINRKTHRQREIDGNYFEYSSCVVSYLTSCVFLFFSVRPVTQTTSLSWFPLSINRCQWPQWVLLMQSPTPLSYSSLIDGSTGFGSNPCGLAHCREQWKMYGLSPAMTNCDTTVGWLERDFFYNVKSLLKAKER